MKIQSWTNIVAALLISFSLIFSTLHLASKGVSLKNEDKELITSELGATRESIHHDFKEVERLANSIDELKELGIQWELKLDSIQNYVEDSGALAVEESQLLRESIDNLRNEIHTVTRLALLQRNRQNGSE